MNERYRMKGRKQNNSGKETCPRKNRTASEGYEGGQTFMWITENSLTEQDRFGYGMLESVLSPSNLNAAYRQVKRNKGSGGVDKMEVESLKDYLVSNKDGLIASILRDKYRPSPVRRVEIPKTTDRNGSWASPR